MPGICDNTSSTLSLVTTPWGAEALRSLSGLDSTRAAQERPAHGGSAAEQIPNSDKEVDALLQASEPTGDGLLQVTLDHLRRENAALRARLTQIQQELTGARQRERDARYLESNRKLGVCYAASLSSCRCRRSGYQCLNVACKSSLSACTRICSRRWAPRGFHRICCLLSNRLAMSWLIVDSTKAGRYPFSSARYAEKSVSIDA